MFAFAFSERSMSSLLCREPFEITISKIIHLCNKFVLSELGNISFSPITNIIFVKCNLLNLPPIIKHLSHVRKKTTKGITKGVNRCDFFTRLREIIFLNDVYSH